ncbi:C4-dicarboxylate ABC transporter substrate-binding protein [Hydrogenophaga sp. Root209]|uniref:TRAP transporter substrate-binding protein n=1 Tax=unclassified Hydrogenophaga TaxID=2610897 RepID=UPI0006F5C523|nr:TRAP transporter substrate-binding protein [Hydrogenophaga sp. Root209]KRB97856.1 C4-dicarboxylate ABC transporter substrate-binding protein [Hydrogenophaga sp. Root209]
MKFLVLAILMLTSVAHAQTRWQLATGYRADSFHAQNLAQFADDVEQATAGALRIELRPDNTLFKLAEIRRAVQEGKVEAGETIMSSMVGDIPIAGADAIPFVVHSYGDARRLWHLQRPLIEKHFGARGLKALYVVPWPPQGLFTSQPVHSAADFKGTRMRTYNQSTVRIAEMLDASPVDVPMVEVNQALADRKVDSMITSAVTGVENRVWDQIGFYYGINAWFPKNIVFVNARAFEALPTSAREALTQAAARAEVRGWALSEAVANESTWELQRRGIKVGRVPLGFEAELKRLGEKFSREWVRSVGSEANLIFVPYYLQR